MSQPFNIIAPLTCHENEKDEVEMVEMAGGERKEWSPRKEPFVILKDMPPGYPSLLRPENTKTATPQATERALDHLKSRLTGVDIEWWTSFIAKEREKRKTWEKMTEEEYFESREFFDISALSFKSSPSDHDVYEDEEILRAKAAILPQLNKEHGPVKYNREMHACYIDKTQKDSVGGYLFRLTAYLKSSAILY